MQQPTWSLLTDSKGTSRHGYVFSKQPDHVPTVIQLLVEKRKSMKPMDRIYIKTDHKLCEVEIELLKTVYDLWVWGENYNYTVEYHPKPTTTTTTNDGQLVMVLDKLREAIEFSPANNDGGGPERHTAHNDFVAKQK